MSWTFRIERSILEEIRLDLRRRHSFAWERVGFLQSRLGNRESRSERSVLAERYHPIADDDYIPDLSVGARYKADVHRRFLEMSMASGSGVFHVHMHEHRGSPVFSDVDLECVHKLVPSLRTVRKEQAHGAVLLSKDSVEVLCWLPGVNGPVASGRVVVVGWPLEIFSPVGVRE